MSTNYAEPSPSEPSPSEPLAGGAPVAGAAYGHAHAAAGETGIIGTLAAEHAARVTAEAAVFSRDRVLSIVSHDLRGPLNAIHSWAHVLERKLASEDPGIARAIAGIRTGVEQQVKLIEEVIDKTRAASRNLAVTRIPVAVAPVIEAEAENVRSTVASLKGVTIASALALTDVTADLDVQRFGQAVWTMLSFAVGLTPRDATVELSANAEHSRLEVAVSFTVDNTAKDASLDADTGLASTISVPITLDHGTLPLALAMRVAVAHDGELIDEELVDGRRRIAIRQRMHVTG